MPKMISARMLALVMAIAVFAVAVAGCGSDKPGEKTGEGATAGASGTAAGGVAAEAGKIRDPKDIAAEKKNFSKEPPPIQIQSGNSSGVHVSKPTAIVIQTTPAQRKLKKRVYSDGNNADTWVPTDFKTRQFIGVFMPKLKPGSLIAITDIFQNGKVIKVKTVELTLGDGCKAGKKKPNPWQVVETRKMTGKPVVALTVQKSSPCS